MSLRRRAQLQVIETEPDRAVTRLHHLIRHRDALRTSFRNCWTVISADATDADLDRWAEGSLELAFVNAGPECQFAFWRTSVDLRSELTLNGLADFAHAAADICRGAGAQAALACLQALPVAHRRLPSVGDIALWSRGLIRMAREAPELVVAVASRTDIILQACDSSGFETFIATGLKFTRGDRARRRAFFTLEDRLATQALEQAAGALTFSRDERVLKAYATALWGRPPVLRSAVAPPGGQLARRVNVAGGVVRVPPVFRGVPKNSLPQLFRACVAHATAHVALTRTRFPIGSLKPLQMALIGLVEDARVEALAMRLVSRLAPAVGAISRRRAFGRDYRAGADGAACPRAFRSGLRRPRRIREQRTSLIRGRTASARRCFAEPANRRPPRQRSWTNARAIQRAHLRGRAGLPR